MRTRILICVLLSLCGRVSAQAPDPALPKVTIPESGFLSRQQYTNAFFGFSLPLPDDRRFRVEDLSDTNKVAQHFLFAERAFDKGITTLVVSATQVLDPRDDDAEKTAFLPGMQGGKGPEAINIGGRIFWKSDIQEKTFSGKLRRLRYAASMGAFVLQLSASTPNSRLAESLKDCIESIKFFDPSQARRMAGPDAEPFLPRAVKLRPANAPELDVTRLDPGHTSGHTYVNSYFGFTYRFPEGWDALEQPTTEEFGKIRSAEEQNVPGTLSPLAKCTRVLLRARKDAESGASEPSNSSISLVAADPNCFAFDAKFPTSVHDEEAMQLFGQAMVRAFSGTQLKRQDSITLHGVNLDGHVFVEMPNDIAVPVAGSTLLRKVHSSLVLTSLRDYWVIWIFQADTESELQQMMRTEISFARRERRP